MVDVKNSRRRFLQAAGVVAGGTILESLLGPCRFLSKAFTPKDRVIPHPEAYVSTPISLSEIVRSEKKKGYVELYNNIFGHTRSDKKLDEEINRYSRYIEHFGRYYGVSSDLIRAILYAESGNRQYRNGKTIESPVGAIGIGQHMETNCEELNRIRGLGEILESNRWSYSELKKNAIHNIDATAATLRNLRDEFGAANIETIAVAYNAGKTAVRNAIRRLGLGAETDKHIRSIIALLECPSDKKEQANTYRLRVGSLYNLFSADMTLPADEHVLKGAKYLVNPGDNINKLVMLGDKPYPIYLMTGGTIVGGARKSNDKYGTEITVKTPFGLAYYNLKLSNNVPFFTHMEPGTHIGDMLDVGGSWAAGLGLHLRGGPHVNPVEVLASETGYLRNKP